MTARWGWAVLALTLANPAAAGPLDRKRFAGEYYRVAGPADAMGPVAEALVESTPGGFRLSLSIEECERPILPAGDQWLPLDLRDTSDLRKLDATAGDWENDAPNSLHVYVEDERGYATLHLRMHHPYGEIDQALYPDKSSGGGPVPIGTALNTGGGGHSTIGSGPPIGRPCPKCKPKSAGKPGYPYFFRPTSGPDAPADCTPPDPTSGHVIETAPERGASTGAVGGTASRASPGREASLRDVVSLPPPSHTPSPTPRPRVSTPTLPASPQPDGPPAVQVIGHGENRPEAPLLAPQPSLTPPTTPASLRSLD